MGRASKWFRNLLGLKKPDPNPLDTSSRSTSSLPTKRRWGFFRSNRDKDTLKPVAEHPNCHQNPLMSPYQGICGGDPEEHAVAVAAATAAVAEAAVAAAKAAAAVVRLTSSSGRCTHSPVSHVGRDVGKDRVSFVGTKDGGGGGGRIDNGGVVGCKELAAIKIQSTFRGYLARRALRALKGLVRLQAIVRGHIERKRTAEYLRRMQALIRAQSCARARRILHSESLSQPNSKSSQSLNPSPQTPEKSQHPIRSRNLKNDEQSHLLKRIGSKTNGKFMNDNEKRRTDEWSWDQRIPSCRILSFQDEEKSDKILEIDNGKHQFNPKFRNFFHSSHLLLDPDQHSHSFGTSKDSITHLTMPLSPSSAEVQSLTPKLFTEEIPFCAVDSSPNPVTPAMSDGSRSCQTGYSENPNYMSFTESSKAKVRSFSAPKQRPQYERSGSAKRYHLYGLGESRSSSMKVSGLNADFTGKAYPDSGRLDRFGMPLGS